MKFDEKTAQMILTADESSDTTCFPLFVTAATGGVAPKTGSNLTFNSATGVLGAESLTLENSSGTDASITMDGTGAYTGVFRWESDNNRFVFQNIFKLTSGKQIHFGFTTNNISGSADGVLDINATNRIQTTGGLINTPDAITATDAGVAASLTTLNTEVTTNGDSDLDNVTLANGTSGQIKHIYCVVEGNAADTWKITPATMCGGTQITFSGVGEGCTMVYADNEGWVVVANNGGTIS